MSGKKYTHIFFDLDNTLWDFEKNSYYALHLTFLSFSLNERGYDYDNFFKVYSKHNQKLWEEYHQQKVMKSELKLLRFQKTFDEMKIKGIDPIEMNSFYLDEMPKQNCLIKGARELLNYLKSKGYLLYIITNGFREVQYKKLETTNLENYFKKVFISEDIKAPKPHRKIFEYAIKSANATKKRSLMVGDNINTDVYGALNYGIDAVLLDLIRKNDKQIPIVVKQKMNFFYCIQSLAELNQLL